MDAVGLWLIDKQTFTASSAYDVNGVFSSDFQNYRIIVSAYTAHSSLVSVNFQYRTASTLANGSDYYTKGWYNFTSLTNYAPAAQTNWYVMDCFNNAAYQGRAVLDVFSPNEATRTAGVSSAIETYNTYTYQFNNTHAVGTAYTGFRLSPNTSTITGTVAIYGYRD